MPHPKRLLWLDLDSTLFDTKESAMTLVAARLEEPTPSFDAVTDAYGMHELFRSPERAAREFLDVFSDPGFYQWQLLPYPHAVDALHTLHQNGLLAGYITHRPDSVRQATVQSLRRWSLPELPVHFERDKWQPMQTHPSSVLIDDAAHVLMEVQQRGFATITYHHEYNKHIGGPRVYSWLEVPATLEAINARTVGVKEESASQALAE